MASLDQSLAALGVASDTLAAEEAAALDRDGYVLLRGLIARDRLASLRLRFEAAVRPSEAWPYPRGHDIRHAMLDKDAAFLALCLAPRVLAGVHHMFGRRFFLASFEGREPCQGGGGQNLHRDGLEPPGAVQCMTLLAFLDDFGPANGATRVIPGSHGGDEPLPLGPDPREIVVAGEGGDALLFPSRLIHSGTCNMSGAPRRTLIAAYLGYEQYAGRFFQLQAPEGACGALRYMLGG
jgi:ectoine hydroxylase-related dioxygenase (phytanoyl-CoA dioxygenase family)